MTTTYSTRMHAGADRIGPDWQQTRKAAASRQLYVTERMADLRDDTGALPCAHVADDYRTVSEWRDHKRHVCRRAIGAGRYFCECQTEPGDRCTKPAFSVAEQLERAERKRAALERAGKPTDNVARKLARLSGSIEPIPAQSGTTNDLAAILAQAEAATGAKWTLNDVAAAVAAYAGVQA